MVWEIQGTTDASIGPHKASDFPQQTFHHLLDTREDTIEKNYPYMQRSIDR